jgi:4-hydroxybenzoate polyprenyltransferase
MVRVSHTIFALPFALASAAFAATEVSFGPREILWIVVAMIAARNAAMGFNRLVDAPFDARNPRTARREIPAGVLGKVEVVVFVAALSVLFVLAAGMLNRLCLLLSPLALAIVFGYSYTKRFAWGSQLALGLALAIAPVGAWIAVTGRVAWPAVLLGASVLLWVAGFDTLYALQDIEFDRREGLHSIPARFGPARALAIARLLHGGAVLGLALLYSWLPLHPIYLAGVVAIALVLVTEHWLVRGGDLTRISLAFFTANGLVSVVYGAVATVAVAIGR